MSSALQIRTKPSKGLKKKGKPLVPKWKLFRANEPLLSVFMWGVNHTVRELSHVPPPMLLMPDDFKAFSKVKIDNQSFNKDHMPSHFKIKEYCPNVFRNLRERFGVDDQEYVNWLTLHEPRWLHHSGTTPAPDNARYHSHSTPASPSWHATTLPRSTAHLTAQTTSPRGSSSTFLDKILLQQDASSLNICSSTRRGHWLASYNSELIVRVTRRRDVVERLDEMLAKYHQRSLTWGEAMPEGETSGRSGAKFYRSYDDKFILKTMGVDEIAEVHSTLRQYHGYVVEKHGKTLLPQYLGMYRTTVDGTETYLIVMRNILGRKYPVHTKYDLKGSTVQRAASDKEKAKDLPTYKDNDFLEAEVRLHLPSEAETKLVDMLTSDTKFLAKLKLMDYSLLVGIHDCDKFERDEKEKRDATAATGESSGGEGLEEEDDDQISQPTPPDSPIPSTGAFAPCLDVSNAADLDHEFYAINSKADASKREIYFIGLVDILTYYGVKKRTATAAKSVKYGAEADISTIAPDAYGRRMVEFVARHILHRKEVEETAAKVTSKSTASRTQSASGSQDK